MEKETAETRRDRITEGLGGCAKQFGFYSLGKVWPLECFKEGGWLGEINILESSLWQFRD